MRAPVVVEIEEDVQSGSQGQHRCAILDVDVLVLDGTLRPLDENVVKHPAATVHADVNIRRL
jgi:hypothetical protein